MKKKLISIIIIIIMLLLLNQNFVDAVSPSELTQMGPESVGQEVQITFRTDMNTSSNKTIYCMSQGQRNGSSVKYKVGTYVEIADGIARVWDVNGLVGAESSYAEENKVLAEILSGNYGALGYTIDGSSHNYTPTQRGLYYYFSTWIEKVGVTVGTAFWDEDNGYVDNGVGADVVSKAIAAVEAGANPSVKFYLLVNWEAKDNWQKLLIAIPGESSNSRIVVTKKDDFTLQALPNVRFVIKNEEGQYLQAQVVNAVNNEFAVVSFGGTATNFYTNSRGQFIITGLAPGKYTIVETANPNKTSDGQDYIDSDQEVTFLVGNNGSQTVEIYNTPPDYEGGDEEVVTEGEGSVTLSGRVWEDLLRGKANLSNGTIDSDESGVAGVKVYWKASDGTILGSTTTDSNGNYTMVQKIKVYNHVYGIDTDRYNQLNSSYIEFEYNGLKYTTVKLGTSKGKESEAKRANLDNSFKEVTANEVKDGGYRLSYSSGSHSATLNQSNSDFLVSADTKGQVSNLMNNADTDTHSYCIEECTRHGKHGTHSYHRDCSSGKHPDGHTSSHYNCSEEQRVDTWTITNMDLGLVRRENPDIAITSDINRVRVIMKGQEYTYYYNSRGIQNNEELFDYTVKFGNKYTETYRRPVNPSDIAYINYGSNPNEMEVYVTYQIVVKNQSTTLSMTVGEIVNYYDNRYDLQSSGWSNSSKYGSTYNSNGYRAAYTTQLSGEVLAPGAKSSTIEIEFKVQPDTVKSVIGQDVLLKNISEVNIYSTYYGTGTRCSEGREGVNAGQQYAGIDNDSAVGNAVPGNRATYEDDTDEAPTFMLTKDPNYKIISGTVWEDTDVTSNNERLGNGVRDGNEKGVANVKVELLKVNDDGSLTSSAIPVYRIEGGSAVTYDAITYTDANGNYSFSGVVTDNYVIKYTYGDGNKGECWTYDIGSDSYTGRTTVGASTINGNAINARNYKSTIITQDPIESVFKGADNDKWHLTLRNEASIAIDDLDDRLSIPSLKYSNFHDAVNMTAYSAPFRVQIEYTEEQEAQVDANGGDFEHKPDNFDFGIIERPREDIVIDKTIENLKITLANGQVLTEGNPYGEKMNYVRALGKTEIYDRDAFVDSKRREKAIYIEMDTELIQGSRLDILYAITVTNNSEIDYEFDSANGGNGDYYFYGEVNSPLIKPSAEIVVDYVDTELTCTTENSYNTNWTQVTDVENVLYNNGYISSATLDAVKNGNYLVFTTEIFKDLAPGQSHKEYLFASKLLANQAEDYVYENHVEIIQLNDKIARTIDSVEENSRVQARKTYKPGTYVPSLFRDELDNSTDPTEPFMEAAGYHQQDDDMITIRITPPTGLTDNIVLYISVGAVALVVLLVGIIVIRKKVLGK